MAQKILIPLRDSNVGHRFDLATEVMVIRIDGEEGWNENTIVLPHASAEDLCHLILTENIDVVICGGIEDEYYQYLTWKKVRIVDSVMGPWENALSAFIEGRLEPGAVLYDCTEAGIE